MSDRCFYWESPLGRITLVCERERLTGLYFPSQLATARPLLKRSEQVQAASDATKSALPLVVSVCRYLEHYFSGKPITELPSVCAAGTDFQKRVWKELLRIGCGELRTYGEIAKAIEKPSASRAVGKAIGDNPISLLIPCHRVIGQNGSLTGYAGGLEIKRWLLRHEGHRFI
jgi:methylated-DNA-[protein]-cysteine S-methyltransferase